MIELFLAAFSFVRHHWRLAIEAALAAVLVLTGAYAYVMHETAGMWMTRVKLTQANVHMAVEQTKRAKANYETLQTAIDVANAKLEAEKTASEALKARIEARVQAAEETAREARKRAAERAAELEDRMAGLDECQQCEESLNWLIEEVAR